MIIKKLKLIIWTLNCIECRKYYEFKFHEKLKHKSEKEDLNNIVLILQKKNLSLQIQWLVGKRIINIYYLIQNNF